MTRLQMIIVIILAVLLGAAGWWWFHEWYGLLTAAGAGALRVGSTFVWRVWWRYIRRKIFRELYRFAVPSFIKRPLHAFGMYIRERIHYYLEPLREPWKRSALLRAAILGPVVVLLCIAAYYAEGIWEFLWLTPIPFLVAEILPEWFGPFILSTLMHYLALVGLEKVVVRVVAWFPTHVRGKMAVWRYRLSEAMARRRRENRAWQALQEWDRKRRTKK